MAEEQLVGKVTHYYGKLGVAIVELSAPLAVGQQIHVKGAHDDFTQEVKDMQFEHQAITAGRPKQQVGIKVEKAAHENDQVFLA